jgi:hypothetical protein
MNMKSNDVFGTIRMYMEHFPSIRVNLHVPIFVQLHIHEMAAQQLRRLVAGFPPRRPGFNPS